MEHIDCLHRANGCLQCKIEQLKSLYERHRTHHELNGPAKSEICDQFYNLFGELLDTPTLEVFLEVIEDCLLNLYTRGKSGLCT